LEINRFFLGGLSSKIIIFFTRLPKDNLLLTSSGISTPFPSKTREFLVAKSISFAVNFLTSLISLDLIDFMVSLLSGLSQSILLNVTLKIKFSF